MGGVSATPPFGCCRPAKAGGWLKTDFPNAPLLCCITLHKGNESRWDQVHSIEETWGCQMSIDMSVQVAPMINGSHPNFGNGFFLKKIFYGFISHSAKYGGPRPIF